MRAFLEKCYTSKTQGEWMDDYVYTSNNVLRNRGVEVIAFDSSSLFTIDIHKPTKEDIIIGSVEATSYFFNLINVKEPGYIGYPKGLEPYLKRKIERVSIGKLLEEDKYPYFIKPADKVKLFTGELIHERKDLEFMMKYMGVTNELLVYKSEPLIDMNFGSILSEYRCFVFKGELKGIQQYAGDCSFQIDPMFVKHAIHLWKDAPIAYTLDFACVGKYNRDTVLIEVNDFWAIGGYGFNPDMYVTMAINRFRQIVNQSNEI